MRKVLTQMIHSSELSMALKDCLRGLSHELQELSSRIDRFEVRVRVLSTTHPTCKRLQKIDGIGPITSAALIAAIGDGTQFKNGKQCAAWMGLIPKQWSSGGKPKLGRMSKHGNRHLRALLVQGAKSVVRYSKNKTDKRNSWVRTLAERKGPNKAAIAMANKNARTAWAILTNHSEYDGNFVPEPFTRAA